MGEKANSLTNAVSTIFSLNGWFVWRGGSGALKVGPHFARFGHVGASDLYALKPGRFLAIEIKAGKDQQKDMQAVFQRRVEEAGHVYVIFHSTDEALAWLANDKTTTLTNKKDMAT